MAHTHLLMILAGVAGEQKQMKRGNGGEAGSALPHVQKRTMSNLRGRRRTSIQHSDKDRSAGHVISKP